MQTALVLLFLTGAYPVGKAWQANCRHSLSHAVRWMVAAWIAWGGMMVCDVTAGAVAGLELPRYLALCLTGCAGVAVLGARRPGVGAWDFVVLGLLAVLLLPLAENLLTTGGPLGFIRSLFLALTLGVGILNYLPTRLALPALALAIATVGEFSLLDERIAPATQDTVQTLAWLALGLSPWLGVLAWRRRPSARSAFDRRWLDFRDRFGLLWGQRVREQFNRAAANAGWPVHLSWRGLRLLPGASLARGDEHTAMTDTLEALLKRFDGTDSKTAAS